MLLLPGRVCATLLGGAGSVAGLDGLGVVPVSPDDSSSAGLAVSLLQLREAKGDAAMAVPAVAALGDGDELSVEGPGAGGDPGRPLSEADVGLPRGSGAAGGKEPWGALARGVPGSGGSAAVVRGVRGCAVS